MKQVRLNRKWIVLIALVSSLAATILLNGLTAHAAGPMTIHVTRTDDGPQDAGCLNSGTNCTLRNAIATANANPGSMIKLTLYKSYVLTDTAQGALDVTANMTITTESICLGIPCPVLIQGTSGWSKGIMTIHPSAQVYLENLNLKYGASGAFYGGALSNNGVATVSLCNFLNNSSTSQGGSIYNSGTFNMSGGSISHSSADKGGGIYNSYTGVMTLTGVAVFTNTVSTMGGGIYNQGNLTLDNSNVYSNTATGNINTNAAFGGGVYNYVGNLWLINNTIIRNNQVGYGSGGGLANFSGHVWITNSQFNYNSISIPDAMGNGGGIVNSGTMQIQGASQLYSNSAPNEGGGIDNWDTLIMTDTWVMSNTAGDSGGGIRNNGNAQLSNLWLNANTANYGGGIQNYGAGILQLSNDTNLEMNTGFIWGGGLNNTGTAQVTANSILVLNNQAPLGAGIFQTSTMTMTLNNTFIGFNTAANSGGGLYAAYHSGLLSIDQSTVQQNSATNGRGGGLYLDNLLDSVTINHTTFYSNTAPATVGFAGGGAIYSNATLFLYNSTVDSNSTGLDGGGINQINTQTFIINTTISGNSAKRYGGGLYATGDAFYLYNTSIISNTAVNLGGGMYASGTASRFRNTMIAGNSAPTAPDCAGNYTSQGYSLVQLTLGCVIVTGGLGDLFNLNPKIDKLKNNGGPTKTHALLSGSPAINAGDPAGCVDSYGQPLTHDQRGYPRPVGPRCDIGAYEMGTWLYLPLIVR